MSILENHTMKYKPFVNPFYKEGIGRRTGAVLKTEVRKDSDGFEIFDDYFSESEADNSELSFAVGKENISANANRDRRTGQQKMPANQKRSSPLRPMKSFSPAASTDRSVVKSPDDIPTHENEKGTQGDSGNREREDIDEERAEDEVAGNSEAENSLSDMESQESSSEDEMGHELQENMAKPAREVAGKSEAESQQSDKYSRHTSEEDEVLDENTKIPDRGVTKNETEIQTSDEGTRETSSEEEEVSGLEENKTVPPQSGIQEEGGEKVVEDEREKMSEEEENVVTSTDDDDAAQDETEKETYQGEEELNEEGVSDERSSGATEAEKMKSSQGDTSVKKQPNENVDSPLQAQTFAMTKKRLSFSCATEEDVPASSHKEESKVTQNKEEKMNNILENPDKEELVGENQDKPSFMDMINSKRTSGAVFSFRFSEILSSTANVSDHRSNQPDDDNVVIVSEENEKSFFGKTSHKKGMKESAKPKVNAKDKSEKSRKSKGAVKKLKGDGKEKAKSVSEDSGSNQTVIVEPAEVKTKDKTMRRERSLEKSKMEGGLGEKGESVQNHQVSVDGTSQMRGHSSKGSPGNDNGSQNDEVDSGDTDANHVPDVNTESSEDQVFVEASEDQSMTEIRKEETKSRSSRRNKSTSRGKEDKKPLEKVKEDLKTDKMGVTRKGASEEDEDEIVIGDAAGDGTTEVRKENIAKRRNSRRLKSTSKAKKEKNDQSRVKEISRREKEGHMSKNSSEMEKTAATEVNSDEDEIVIGGLEVHNTTETEREGTRKRSSSKPLKSTSKGKEEKKNNQNGVKEISKMKRKGSDSEMLSEVGKTATSEGTSSDDEDNTVIGDLQDGSTNIKENKEASVSKVDAKKTTGRQKSVSTAGNRMKKSKRQESESASQEGGDGTIARQNTATTVTGQRRSKRIRSRAENVSEREESYSDKGSRKVRKDTVTEKDEKVVEMEGRAKEDGSSFSGETEALKEQSSSSDQGKDVDVEGTQESKLTKKLQVKEKKGNRAKTAKKKNLSLEEGIKNDERSQLDETKNKRMKRATSLASSLHASEDDGGTKEDEESNVEDEKEQEIDAIEDKAHEDGASKDERRKSQGDRNDSTNEIQVKGSSRKRKSTSLHSTKTKVKRGEKSKVERINAVKKTLDYADEDSDREDIIDDGGEVVGKDGTVEGDDVPTDPKSDTTSPNRVSHPGEMQEDSDEKEVKKNDSTDQRQKGSSYPQSILKSSKVYRKHPKHRRQRNLRLTFHEIAKPRAFIIPPNRENKGARRSKRNRVRPLEFWRNERAIYERRKSGGFALMGINSPEYPESPYQKTGKPRKKQRASMHTRLLTPKNLSLHRSAPDDAVPGCSDPVVVVNPESQREVLVDVVKTPQSNVYVGPSGNQASETDSFILTKALMQPAFSSGIIKLRPESEKGLQLVQRDTMVFHIVRGKLSVTIHQTTQILESGAFFFVPQGNVYNIVNLRKDEAKLVFCQLKGSVEV